MVMVKVLLKVNGKDFAVYTLSIVNSRTLQLIGSCVGCYCSSDTDTFVVAVQLPC